jgi:hypothetical protein
MAEETREAPDSFDRDDPLRGWTAQQGPSPQAINHLYADDYDEESLDAGPQVVVEDDTPHSLNEQPDDRTEHGEHDEHAEALAPEDPSGDNDRDLEQKEYDELSVDEIESKVADGELTWGQVDDLEDGRSKGRRKGIDALVEDAEE